ncbi:hypothetical protein EJ06DRAFT_491965 [Trichodelitschia bisporula]|uniref:Rab-GAP TBC domain-containing protein n=1 Tax=Trichodelitschia bisporula TaxID=703511 RepID=A0A6G1I195_9PEZI|nr:hypothetical protein EJ06DRAFT_491965 [Trichodelitschia bisporula]
MAENGDASPASSACASAPSPHEKDKAERILEACRNHDLDSLAALATSPGGLVDDALRRTAWPVLLGCTGPPPASDDATPWSELPPHRDEGQVALDVNRSFVFYPNNQSDKELEIRKQQLSDVIVETLRRHPSLCYFQGFHDIAQVLLLVLGPEESAYAVRRLSLLRIRDFMLPTLTAALQHLHLLPSILYAEDPELCTHLPPNPFFALSATITLYAHDIEEYSSIARLFDFLLAREAVMSVYLFAVIILVRKDELLEVGLDEPEMLHFLLSKLPQPLDLEGLIEKTMSLFERHPPERLPFRAWRGISQYSVLKTTRDYTALARMTLGDGEELLDMQARYVRRQEALQKLVAGARKTLRTNKRPIMFSLAIVMGVLAVFMGRKNGTQPYWSGLLWPGLWQSGRRGLAALF